MSIWLKNQPWNPIDPPPDVVDSEVEWNLWQTRLPPFSEIDSGDTLYLAYGGHGKNSYVTWETQVTHVLRTRYRSFADAARSLNETFGNQVDDPKRFHEWEYCQGRPSSGWLFALSYEPVRKLDPPVQRAKELHVSQSGWGDLSDLTDTELRRLGLIGDVVVSRGRSGSVGQGLLSEHELRVLIEKRAMAAARDYLKKELGFTGDQIIDTSANRPYDLECQTGGKPILRVEVKGTRGTGASVRVTRGEVDHALADDVPTALFVLSGIQLVPDGAKAPRARGGEPAWYSPWRPASSRLRAETYTYRIR